MFMLINKAIKINKINFCFLKNDNKLLVTNFYYTKFLVLWLPHLYFYSYISFENFKFLFLNKFFFFSFLNHVNYLITRFVKIFFLKLKLRGLGFRIRRFGRFLYRFYFTKTNYIYFHIPKNLMIKRRKKKLLLFGTNYHLVRLVFAHIMLLHLVGPYNRRGFTYPRQIILLKKAKKIT